jgi:hypothetical protein
LTTDQPSLLCRKFAWVFLLLFLLTLLYSHNFVLCMLFKFDSIFILFLSSLSFFSFLLCSVLLDLIFCVSRPTNRQEWLAASIPRIGQNERRERHTFLVRIYLESRLGSIQSIFLELMTRPRVYDSSLSEIAHFISSSTRLPCAISFWGFFSLGD